MTEVIKIGDQVNRKLETKSWQELKILRDKTEGIICRIADGYLVTRGGMETALRLSNVHLNAQRLMVAKRWPLTESQARKRIGT